MSSAWFCHKLQGPHGGVMTTKSGSHLLTASKRASLFFLSAKSWLVPPNKMSTGSYAFQPSRVRATEVSVAFPAKTSSTVYLVSHLPTP